MRRFPAIAQRAQVQELLRRCWPAAAQAQQNLATMQSFLDRPQHRASPHLLRVPFQPLIPPLLLVPRLTMDPVLTLVPRVCSWCQFLQLVPHLLLVSFQPLVQRLLPAPRLQLVPVLPLDPRLLLAPRLLLVAHLQFSHWFHA
jgi:hypothetical protein